jgi:hypothetical protein
MYVLGLLYVFALTFDMCEKSVRNGTDTTTGWFCFILISKKEREMNLEREFVALSE